MMVDSTNTVVWEATYKPFGEAEVNPGSTVVNNFRFPGQYYDIETGMHYNWHRYYDPSTGRYLTPDPIGLAGGINLYTYTANNPINYTDPEGLDWLLNKIFGYDRFQDIPISKPYPNRPVWGPAPVPKPFTFHIL